MARLVYSTIGSLDGFTNDRNGNFEWAAPDDEVLAFVNEQERPIGTYLYGRRMYEVMAGWEQPSGPMFDAPLRRDFAEIWQSADKVVFSSTLDSVSTARTRLERRFDPTTIRQLKESAELDISIGGPTLAAAAIRVGLVDDWHLFLHPIVVGGGTPVVPDGVRIAFELIDERRFVGGVTYLHYRPRPELT